MSLEPCPHCHRHIRVGVGTCPFCGTGEPRAGSSAVEKAVVAAACIGLALTACGCYGPPPPQRGIRPVTDPMQPEPPAAQAVATDPQPGQTYAQPPSQQTAR
ncbi:MAG TPA: hypothetical protein PLI95_01255 [Polyangiaceae bacterium]|nr:hypothetical protein [Polyangiaceae bacterium]